MSVFQQPSKTKTLFAQIEAGRPAAARVKLGSAEQSQSVLNSQTAAQNKENQGVQQQQQMVTDNTKQGVENVGMKPVFAEGTKAAQRAQAVGGHSNPAFVTSVGSGIGTDKTLGNGFAVDNGTLPKSSKAATATNKEVVAKVSSDADLYGNPLENYAAPVLSEQLGKVYNTEADKLAQSEKELTEGNLGLLAPESDFEIQQAQNAQVLADRESNIGKLRSLYGVGYDASKYGALDSNLLQGQFNDAAVTSQDALQHKEMSKRAGEQVRQSYANNIDKSETLLSDAKTKSDEQITKLSTEVQKGKEALAEMVAKYGPQGTVTIPAMKKLADDVAKKEKELKDAAPKIAATANYNKQIDNTAKNLGIDKNALLKLKGKPGEPGNLDYLINFYDDYLDPAKSKVLNSRRVFPVPSGELLARLNELPPEVQQVILSTSVGKTLKAQGEEDTKARQQESDNRNPVQKFGDNIEETGSRSARVFKNWFG